MEQKLEDMVDTIKDMFEMNDKIKNMRDEEKQKVFLEYSKNYYERLFSTYTLKELKGITKQSKKDLIKLHKDYNIQSPIYVTRTYSNGLVPMNSPLGKYDTPTKRSKYNDYFDWEANKEKEHLQNMVNMLKYNLGTDLAICSQNFDKFAKTQQQLKTYNLLLEAYEDAQKKDDWLSFIEEERHGIRPEMENTFDKEIFSDETMYAYISKKYGIEKALVIQHILKGDSYEVE